MRDFTGHANPYALAEYAELKTEIHEICSAGDDYWGMGGGVHTLEIEYFLILADASIRKGGLVSRASSKNNKNRPASYPRVPAVASALPGWVEFRSDRILGRERHGY